MRMLGVPQGLEPPSPPARAQVGNGWAAALGLCRNVASVAQRSAGAGLAAVKHDQQHSDGPKP